MDSQDIVLPSFKSAFSRVIEADGPLPPFQGWHMAPQHQPPPAPACQPLVIPDRPRNTPTSYVGLTSEPIASGSRTKRKRGQSIAGQEDSRASHLRSTSPVIHESPRQFQPLPLGHSYRTQSPGPIPLPSSVHRERLSVVSVDSDFTVHSGSSSSAASPTSLSPRTAVSSLTSVGAPSPQIHMVAMPGSVPASATNPQQPYPAAQSLGTGPAPKKRRPSPAQHQQQQPQQQSKTPQAQTKALSNARSPPRPQQGFIILKPSTSGNGLRVAASSARSFGDALDALRHRAAPPEHVGERGYVPENQPAASGGQTVFVADGGEWDDGGVFGTQGAEKRLYTCPFEGCGRKYTFTSNLRRHMRRGHGVRKAGTTPGEDASEEETQAGDDS